MKKNIFVCILVIMAMFALPANALTGEEFYLISEDSGYKIVIPGLLGVEPFDLDGDIITVVKMKTPEKSADGKYQIFEVVTTDPEAYSIMSFPGTYTSGQISYVDELFNNGRVIYKLAASQLFENEVYVFDFSVFDKDNNAVFNMSPLNFVFVNSPIEAPAQPPAPAEEPSSWAKPEIDLALKANLIPEDMTNGYQKDITREDFCRLVVNLVQIKLGKSVDSIALDLGLDLSSSPFTDTNNANIILANKLGIVSGRGNGIFDPKGSITRQEAAVMLTNTAKALDQNIEAADSGFSDAADIASWAKAGVDYTFAKKIMNGVGNNTFNPKGTYTRQQAYISLYRLFTNIE